MLMNRHQVVMLWCGIALIALMCVCVPWIQPPEPPVHQLNPYDAGTKADYGYGLIFLLRGGQRLDAGRLGIQCGLVALVAAGLVVTSRNPLKGP